MKVILTSNIKKLGKIGDLVIVKDGYARNYLLPKGYVLTISPENLTKIQSINRKGEKRNK